MDYERKPKDEDAIHLLKNAWDVTEEVSDDDREPHDLKQRVDAWLEYAREHPDESDLERFPKDAFAGMGRRFYAYLMDILIVVPTMLTLAWILGTFPEKPALEAEDVGLFGLKGSTARLVVALVQLLAYDIYFTVTTFRWGGTWGQKFAGVSILNRDLAMPAKWQARWRYWAVILAMVPLGIGLLTMLWNDKRRAWQDKLTNTYAVKRDRVFEPIVLAASRRTRDKSGSLEDAGAYTKGAFWFILIFFAPGLIVLGLMRYVLGKLGIVGAKPEPDEQRA